MATLHSTAQIPFETLKVSKLDMPGMVVVSPVRVATFVVPPITEEGFRASLGAASRKLKDIAWSAHSEHKKGKSTKLP